MEKIEKIYTHGNRAFQAVGVMADGQHYITSSHQAYSSTHSESMAKYLDRISCVAIFHNDEELACLIRLLQSLIPNH
jgi:hypothetical protein